MGCYGQRMDEPDRLATRQEAADYAEVSIWTIGRWIKTGRLTAWRSEAPAGPGQPSVKVDLDEIDRLKRRVAS